MSHNNHSSHDRWHATRGVLSRLFKRLKNGTSTIVNKSIYTRITVVNVVCFALCIGIFISFYISTFNRSVAQYVERDLLRKATRSNYALLQREDWEWMPPDSEDESVLTEGQEDLIDFLADVFDARITVFDLEGNLVATSAKQEVVPGTMVDEKYVEIVKNEETYVGHYRDRDSDERTYLSVIPMGESGDMIENGILLEVQSTHFDRSLAQKRFQIMSVGALMIIAMILLSLYQAMYLSRPLNEITTDIMELKTGGPYQRKKGYPLIELQDLSDRIEELGKKMAQLQTENQEVENERTRLFAETSHELRTPLTAIQGYVEAIRDGVIKDREMMDRYIDIIYTQTLHINRLVDDLLQLSRLESGVVSLEKLPVNLSGVAEQAATSMESIAKARNTKILLDSSSASPMIIGDVDRLQQVFKNLLQNALNATENGEVKISIDEKDGKVVVIVSDNGTGIAEEDLPHIWDRFYRNRVPGKGRVSHQSSGLGLVIVKQLVELHHGSIDVKSRLGKGTVFTMNFPVLNKEAEVSE